MTIAVDLKIDVRSSKRVRARFDELDKMVKDTRTANRRVGVWLLRWINQNFRTQGGRVGRWKRFKAGGRYVGRAGTRRLDKSAKLLQDTGRLRASFDWKATRSKVTVGSDLPYSKYHEEGVPRRNLPERRMLPQFSDADVTAGILKIYNTHIERALR